ncbi:hypothetical protein GJV03_08135 [Acinetobacter sp. RIT698]|uniref:hypothetical protein n=1 Tax=Acinetobacter sp. RIT698 TaxID=2666192 RepID=UPI0012AC88FE|nr:hypothetical protein [Acinetobacter sp. RIT698]MRT37126.1 hypothetical protein [Acinetobacter sp. RIT698]
MSYKSEGNFELKFNNENESEFEVICEDQGNASVIHNILMKLPSVSKVLPNIDLDHAVPYKINGKTTDQNVVLVALQEFDKTLTSKVVTEYKDFDD